MTRDAKNEQEYKDAWNWHIQQLATLALQARIDYTEYMEVKTRLIDWITKAVDRNNATKQRNCHE